MHAFLTVLIGLLLLAVLGVLLAGTIGMARGMDGRTSNKLMQWRVLLQAGALLLLLLMMSMLRS
jgi:Hypoxia induced protein conserved region